MSRDPRMIALAALLLVAVVLGVTVVSTGPGADLSETTTVTITVRVLDVPKIVSGQIAAGDSVSVDPAGMGIGTVTDVSVGPQYRSVSDASGQLQSSPDPNSDEVIVTIESEGRQGGGVIAIENQVVQAGQTFDIITPHVYLRGQILTVEAR